MLSRSQIIFSKIKELYEELFFPTQMNLREMTQSEVERYKSMNFPDSSAPLIGSFLNVTWIAILDYTGLVICSIDNPEKSYIIPYRAKSSTELATVFCNVLDNLVWLTNEQQLYDRDFLAKHKFTPETNTYG